jgi:anti-sigma factor RsiW
VKYDDETLMAYADGELDAAQRAQIDAAIAQDPGLALRVQEHRALRARMTGAFSRVLDQPVPDRLEVAARVGTPADAPARGNVIKFPARSARAPSPPWRAREWIAMAASLLLGVLCHGACSCRQTQRSSRRARAVCWPEASSPAHSRASSPANKAVKSEC